MINTVNPCENCSTVRDVNEAGYKVFTFRNPYLGNTCVPFLHWACDYNCAKDIEIPGRIFDKETYTCDVILQTAQDRRHRNQILAVWSKTDLQPLKQNLCLASDSKKVKAKSSLNSLGITDMVLDNQ